MSKIRSDSEEWKIRYNHYDPKDEGRREALLALGNGYVVSRSAGPETIADGIHYPGTYRAGCYNRLTTIVEGKAVENESLVNLPNWLVLTFRIQGGKWFSLDKVGILAYEQELDMANSILRRTIRFRDEEGRETQLLERRFVSMAQPHLMALEIELVAENWSGNLEVMSGIDGKVLNNNVKRYAAFNNRHLVTVSMSRNGEDTIALRARTIQSGIELAYTARTTLFTEGRKANVERVFKTEEDSITDFLQLSVKLGEHIIIEKIVSFYTSRDFAISDCCEESLKAIKVATNFETLYSAHADAWKRLWRRCRIDLYDKNQLRYFRLHMFQIMQNLSVHTAEEDVGVPPSGLQGEEYHGQIFWDELFIFPFLIFRFPTIARSLLLYRYRRLGEARRMAKDNGYRGAMFPWRSASTGREETPSLQLNLISGHWMEDCTYLQRHIGAIIAFNVCYYVKVTDDQVFLQEYGAELLFEIARFWASIAQYNPAEERYDIKGVVGPDEYHTRYPEASNPGIDNNTYTNVIASWTLTKAVQVWSQLSPDRRHDLGEKLSLNDEELDHWDKVSKKLRIVFQSDGILSQFQGFSNLEKFDMDQFRRKYGKQRIDWTIEAVGDSVERYQISKQADFSLLLYLFSPSELCDLLEHMGYSVSQDQLKHSLAYHIDHSAHGSSLSRIVHAGALARLDPLASWKYFQEAQLIDLVPEEDKGTSEGIHIGAMGGTLDVLQYHYLGVKIRSGVLEVDPIFPPEIDWVQITLYLRGVEVEIEATQSKVAVRSVHEGAAPLKVRFRSHVRELMGKEAVSFNLSE